MKNDSHISLLRELAQRPALNGGWEKLARQQEEQMVRLEKLERRMCGLRARIVRWGRWGKWALGLLGTVAASVFGRLVYDILQHVAVK